MRNTTSRPTADSLLRRLVADAGGEMESPMGNVTLRDGKIISTVEIHYGDEEAIIGALTGNVHKAVADYRAAIIAGLLQRIGGTVTFEESELQALSGRTLTTQPLRNDGELAATSFTLEARE